MFVWIYRLITRKPLGKPNSLIIPPKRKQNFVRIWFNTPLNLFFSPRPSLFSLRIVIGVSFFISGYQTFQQWVLLHCTISFVELVRDTHTFNFDINPISSKCVCAQLMVEYLKLPTWIVDGGISEISNSFSRIISPSISQGSIPKCESPILIKFGINVISKKIFHPYFFLSATVDVGGVKTTLKIGGAILSNISEMIEDTVFV